MARAIIYTTFDDHMYTSGWDSVIPRFIIEVNRAPVAV